MAQFPRPHRITIEERSTAKDSFGGQSEDWTPISGTFYANIRPLTGRALEAAQAIHAEITHEIQLPYDERITAAHRGVFCGRIFEFKAVINVGEACEETRIAAAEGLTRG